MGQALVLISILNTYFEVLGGAFKHLLSFVLALKHFIKSAYKHFMSTLEQ